ncbi:MAG: collagen binding domain-containing protein [Mycobacteriales bacterium]
MLVIVLGGSVALAVREHRPAVWALVAVIGIITVITCLTLALRGGTAAPAEPLGPDTALPVRSTGFPGSAAMSHRPDSPSVTESGLPRRGRDPFAPSLPPPPPTAPKPPVQSQPLLLPPPNPPAGPPKPQGPPNPSQGPSQGPLIPGSPGAPLGAGPAGFPHRGGLRGSSLLPPAAPPAAPAASVPQQLPVRLVEDPVPQGGGYGPVRVMVRRSDAAPVAEAALTLVNRDGDQIGLGHTGPDGTCVLPVGTRGTYVLITRARRFQPEAHTVEVDGGAVDVQIILNSMSRLTGTVSVAGGGPPLGGATLTLADMNGDVVDARQADSNGRYQFDDLGVGTYTLAATAQGCTPKALLVVITDNGTVERDVELDGGTHVRGTVWAKVGRRRLADARVTLLDRSGAVLGTTFTDANGEYAFGDLPEGEYTVIASGYPPVASSLRVTELQSVEHDVELAHPDR